MSWESPGQERLAQAGRAGASEALRSVLANRQQRNLGAEAQGPWASFSPDGGQPGALGTTPSLVRGTLAGHCWDSPSCLKAVPEQVLVRPRRWAVRVPRHSAPSLPKLKVGSSLRPTPSVGTDVPNIRPCVPECLRASATSGRTALGRLLWAPLHHSSRGLAGPQGATVPAPRLRQLLGRDGFRPRVPVSCCPFSRTPILGSLPWAL